MARREYDEATRGAVIAALMVGQSVHSVAKEYKIPPATVRGWKNKHADPAVKAATSDPGNVLGEALFDYVLTSLRSLKKQAAVFGDETWVRKQGAHELGVLHGILTDKAVRLLEAMSSDD